MDLFKKRVHLIKEVEKISQFQMAWNTLFFIFLFLSFYHNCPNFSPVALPCPAPQSMPTLLSMSEGHLDLSPSPPFPSSPPPPPIWSSSVCSIFPCLWFCFDHLFCSLGSSCRRDHMPFKTRWGHGCPQGCICTHRNYLKVTRRPWDASGPEGQSSEVPHCGFGCLPGDTQSLCSSSIFIYMCASSWIFFQAMEICVSLQFEELQIHRLFWPFEE